VKRIALLMVALGAACAQAPPARPILPQPAFTIAADSLIQISDLNQAHWGIEVLDPERNVVVYSHDANRHHIPASNTKLVVTTVAMGTLGPEFRYRTEIKASGSDPNAPRRLLVIARGDPTWSARFNRADWAVLEQLADSLRAAGIQRADSLVIDASYLGSERVNSTWEVGDLPFTSAPPIGSLAIAEGEIKVVVTPGATVGAPATAAVLGVDNIFPLRVSVVTDTAKAPRNVDVSFEAWPDTIVLSGRVPLDRPDTSDLAAPDVNRFAALALAATLGRRGIATSLPRIVYDSTEAAALRATAERTVAAWESPPMSAIVAGILQPSQNWIAEQVVRTLGAEKRGRGTWSSGLDVERRYLIDVARIDSTAFFLRDASGLSAQNLLSPRAITQILEHVRNQSWGEVYRQGLPSPGVPRSTLSNRLQGYEGKIFAKTGTITNVASLSGYATTKSGRQLIFSIMVNSSGRPSAAVRRGIDRLAALLVDQTDWK
jgi:serine-type D-Ala-D-Ala carboxypeptidase/endopeptidase (penicillin-binding protein 4)